MKKLAILFALLVAASVQWYFNARCIHFQTDRAVVTPLGVYCFVDRVELVKPYMLLRDLEEREEKQMRQIDPRMKINYPIENT